MLKTRKSKVLLLGTLISAFSATAVLAANSYTLTCTNKDCGYKGNVRIGGGRMFDSITGYCAHDKQFVYLQWKRGEQAPMPIVVWDPKTGQNIEMYHCPKCDEPILPIKDIKDLKYCPQCHQATLEYKLGAIID